MQDEIKEILEKPNVYSFNDECYLYFGDYNKLKDYITNLQKENERLHTRIKTIKRRRKAQTAKMRKYREELTNKQNSIVDYKLRNEKAIEIIKFTINLKYEDEYVGLFINDVCNTLLYVLQGENNES